MSADTLPVERDDREAVAALKVAMDTGSPIAPEVLRQALAAMMVAVAGGTVEHLARRHLETSFAPNLAMTLAWRLLNQGTLDGLLLENPEASPDDLLAHPLNSRLYEILAVLKTKGASGVRMVELGSEGNVPWAAAFFLPDGPVEMAVVDAGITEILANLGTPESEFPA